MKKKFAIALSVLMLFGAVKGMAEEGDYIDYEITMGKLDAAELNYSVEKIERQIKQLNSLQESLADVENSNGLIRDIGQTVTTAEAELKEIDQSFDLVKARKLSAELTQIIKNVKKMKAQLRK